MLILVWPGHTNILVGMALAIPLPPPLRYVVNKRHNLRLTIAHIASQDSSTRGRSAAQAHILNCFLSHMQREKLVAAANLCMISDTSRWLFLTL